jgi:hypothetical protein
MRLFRPLRSLAALTFLLGAVACRPEQSVTAPSGEQSVFAQAYPARLSAVRGGFAEQEKRARANLPGLRTPPAGLRDNERELAKAVFERADRSGRSGYYADEAVHQEALDELFEDGRAGLRRKVAGSVSYTVKQKKCGELDCGEELATELGNTAAYAADRALERQQEQRLDAHSDAAHYLDAHSAELGARNLDALGKQSRTLTRTSFIAYVRLELYRRELESLLEEEASASSTLERSETEDRAALAQSGVSKAQKTALERRLADTSARRAELAKEAPLAKTARDEMADRIEALQDDYQEGLSALLAALDQPATPAASTSPAAPAASSTSPAAPGDRNAGTPAAPP